MHEQTINPLLVLKARVVFKLCLSQILANWQVMTLITQAVADVKADRVNAATPDLEPWSAQNGGTTLSSNRGFDMAE